MLSRTADHLFWMARYTERAENTARMLDVNYQTSLLPQSAEVAEQGWWAMLDISELTQVFDERYGLLSRDDVIDFMVRDMTNPSSIMSCLRGARENARAVRGSITTEVWETINTTWLDVQRLIAEGMLRDDPSQFSSGSSSARTSRAACRLAPCSPTTHSTSCVSARSSSAPTTPRGCST